MSSKIHETGVPENLAVKVITFSEFARPDLDPRYLYDWLPGDAICIEGENDARTAAALAELLLKGSGHVSNAILDSLSAKLLNKCASIDQFEHWSEAAVAASRIMAENLTASGSRSLRMRAQRVNYLVEGLIAKRTTVSGLEFVLSEKPLGGLKPWDHLRIGAREWWISSDEGPNVICREDEKVNSWRRGLPTQIDLVANNWIALGSLYTSGADLTDGQEWRRINHTAPVVCVFIHDGDLLFLDHFGHILRESTREVVAQINRPQVHFARYLNGRLFALDNMDFGHITCIKMTGMTQCRIDIYPIRVCNDIAWTPLSYYLIDKQQGGIFKFSHRWEYERKALGFGRGHGRLFDPVSLRASSDRLAVVSWITGRLTEVSLF